MRNRLSVIPRSVNTAGNSLIASAIIFSCVLLSTILFLRVVTILSVTRHIVNTTLVHCTGTIVPVRIARDAHVLCVKFDTLARFRYLRLTFSSECRPIRADTVSASGNDLIVYREHNKALKPPALLSAGRPLCLVSAVGPLPAGGLTSY